MIAALLQFGDSSSGIGALGVDSKALIIQLISFILAFLVLKKWAFGPILKVLAERRETIESGVKLGEKMRQDEAALAEKVSKTLHEARSRADGIISEANDSGRQIVQTAEDKAREKADSLLKAAESRIEQETARAKRQLEGEVAGLVAEATEVIIHEKIDPKKDASLIDEALKGRSAA